MHIVSPTTTINTPSADGIGEEESLLAATRSLRLINDGAPNAKLKAFAPGPASHHYSSVFSTSARAFSDWPAVRMLLRRDSSIALSKLRVFHTEDGFVFGLQSTYYSSASGESVEMPVRKADTIPDVFSEVLVVLTDGEGIVQMGCAFDERSRLRRLQLVTNRGRIITAPPAVASAMATGATAADDEPFMHIADVPSHNALVAFCGHIRAHDLLPGFLTLPLIWPKWGWLILARHRLLQRGEAAATGAAAAATFDSTLGSASCADCAGDGDASYEDRLVSRLLHVDNDDIFRAIVRRLL